MDRRQNNGSVKAVSSRHCAATSALRNCCFNCRAGQNHKDNVRCTAVEEQLACHLFWANLRVQLHLRPLDLAWNPEDAVGPAHVLTLQIIRAIKLH